MAHYRGSSRTEGKITVQCIGEFGCRKMFLFLWVCMALNFLLV